MLSRHAPRAHGSFALWPSLASRLTPLVLIILALAAPAPAQLGPFIRLEDVVAGGDGSGNAPFANTGVDPRTGQFTTGYWDGRLFDSDGVNPSPVPDSPYIDSVFFLGPLAPCPNCDVLYGQPITQSGTEYSLFRNNAGGSGWNFILKNRAGGVSTTGLYIGSQEYFTSSIGLHASMGITFDLDALRARHGDAAVGCFNTFWGMDPCSIGAVEMHVVLSSDGGILDRRMNSFVANQGEEISVPIPPAARYLTLITGPAGGDNCDHGTFARPFISPMPCPAFSPQWIWRVFPSRIRPEGGDIHVFGEGLYSDVTFRLAGVDLGETVFFDDPTHRQLAVPPIPPGVYDLVANGIGFDGPVTFPRAVEVAPAPSLTRATPSLALADRSTRTILYGTNLRPDMLIRINEVGEDGDNVRLEGQTFISEGAIGGAFPRLGSGDLGPRTIRLDDQGRLYLFPDILSYVNRGIERVEPFEISSAGGTAVTFHGLGFTPAMGYRIGGVAITGVGIHDNGRRVTGVSPALSPGLHHVQLVNADGLTIHELENVMLSVVPAQLAIRSVVPGRIYSLGGANLSVKTTRPHGGAAVRVGGLPLANAAAPSENVLTGEAPVLAAGIYDVELVGEDGETLATAHDALEVIVDPEIRIDSVAPSVVSTKGGTEVTITGAGFSPGFMVRLGGLPLEAVEVESPTLLRAITPPLEAGIHAASVAMDRIPLASLAAAIQAVPPDVPQDMVIGHVRPARIVAGSSRVRFAGRSFPGDLVPRIGGVPLEDFRAVSPCRYEGTAPDLPPGHHVADVWRPGFGVVAQLDELVEIANAGLPPRPTHVVSAPVQRDGSTRIYVFGNDFRAETRILIDGKPLTDVVHASDELIVGNAPALDGEEEPGLRSLRAEDDRGGATLENGVRYEAPSSSAVPFARADSNASGRIDLSDAVYILQYLFLGDPITLPCLDAADADSSGTINLTDAIAILQYLFLGGSAPAAPFPGCGLPESPLLGCGSFEPCGAGVGGVTARLFDNVKVLQLSPVSALDPSVVELAPESGELVLRDPPGGVDVAIGDVITGFTPYGSDAVHNGVAYMVKVVGAEGGSCLAAGPNERTLKVRPASIAETIRDGAIALSPPDLFGSRFSASASARRLGICNLVVGGGGASAERGGGGAGVFFDFDLPPFGVLNIQEGPVRVEAGFYKCKVRYNSGMNIGIGIGAGKLTRLTVFSGLLLESDIEFYVDASAFGQIKKEVSLFKLEKGMIVFIGPVPVLLTAKGELFAGVDLQAGIHMYVDAGASASFKAGVGFEFDGNTIRNISGIEPPSVSPLPGTPHFELDGFVRVKGHVRPEVSVFGGLLIKAVTGEIELRPEVYVGAHVEGSTHPIPCFDWGIDAGMKVAATAEVQLFGYDLFDRSFDLLDEEWTDILGGEIGCKAGPVVKLSRTEEYVNRQLLIHLDASGSYDPDGGPLEFRWDFDADGECDRNTGSNPRTTYVYDPATSSPCRSTTCTHVIRLRVTDDEQTFAEKTTSFVTKGSVVTGIERITTRLP